MLTVGELFAGIGGIGLGLERTGGFEVKWQVENDGYATRVLEKHWPNVRRWGDVTTFPPDATSTGPLSSTHPRGNSETEGSGARVQQPERCRSKWGVDIITGGFPCQPVSLAGARKGTADDRWLWDEMYRVCKILRPRWILAENVLGLLSAGSFRGELFGKVAADLATLVADCGGGWVGADCIPAAALGAPHIRDRVFIVAHAEQHGLQGGVAADGQAPAMRRRLTEPDCEGNVPDATDRGQPVCGRTPGPGRHALRQNLQTQGQEYQQAWATEPAVCELDDGFSPGLVRYAGRVATGVPNRVNKLRCLGNAVVPAVAEYIGQRILEAEATRTKESSESRAES